MSERRVYSVFGSSLLTVSMHWTDRAIRVVGTLILARILVPEDFGIVAMASFVIAFADVLLNLGVHVVLIRNPDATQAHYDTAWSIRLLQTFLSSVILVVAAPLAADFFDESRVEPVLRVLALSFLLIGVENIGVTDFQKKMQFGAEFRFRFLRRLTTFVPTVVAALILRSYWAMVIGTVIGHASGVVLSYWLHPMRPRLRFEKFREIFGVSQWLLISNIGAYLERNLHQILVARWSSATVIGGYNLANEISAMPTTGLLAPINRALFPAFAKVKDDVARLKQRLLLAQSMQTLIAMPIAAGVALVAEEAVPVLLGSQWTLAVPFIQVLTLVSIVQSLTTSGFYVLIVLGRVRMNALFNWVRVALFTILALTVFVESEAISVAYLRLLVAVMALWLLFWLLLRVLPVVKARDIAAATVRPLLATTVMALAVLYFSAQIEATPLVVLICKVLIGAFVYVVSLAAFWWFAGRPDGAESYALRKISVTSLRLRSRIAAVVMRS